MSSEFCAEIFCAAGAFFVHWFAFVRALCHYRTEFFTGYCTGKPAFQTRKAVTGEQLHALHSGEMCVLSDEKSM